MTDTPSVDQLARALAATDDLIVAVKDNQWSNPTPCPDWNVHDLVNHLVFGNQLFAGLITEALVHGWDVAQATGQPARLPDDLAEHVLAFSRWQLEDRLPRTARFGEAQPVVDAAPPIERLVAYLGRSVAAT